MPNSLSISAASLIIVATSGEGIVEARVDPPGKSAFTRTPHLPQSMAIWFTIATAACLEVAKALELDHPEGAVEVMRTCDNNRFQAFDPRALRFKPGILPDRTLCDETLNRPEAAAGQARAALADGRGQSWLHCADDKAA